MTAERQHCITLENYKKSEMHQFLLVPVWQGNAAACVKTYMDDTHVQVVVLINWMTTLIKAKRQRQITLVKE